MESPMEWPLWLWAAFNLFILFLLALDLGVLHRKEREIGAREALLLSAGYVAIALIFNAGIFWYAGPDKGLEFLTGYLIEKSLSLDNVFVIALIFGSFAVPKQYQHRVLFWGVLGALVMRAALIFAGIELIQQFRWIVYVFGGFLVLTGIKMLLARGHATDVAANPVVRFVRRHFPVTEGYEGKRFLVRRDGVLMLTPLFLALVMVETTDLIFAVDSIPAILAITQDPFIVYTSNVFAILGLRALYFALAAVIDRFVYLKVGLSLVLVFVGTKMMLVDVWKVPTALALGVTVALIGGSIVLSLLRTRPAASRQAAE
jgi:tellurite resistance protein TerC